MLESIRTVVAEADSAKASTAAAAAAVGKDGGVRPDEATHRSSRGGLFDVILLGGGVGMEGTGSVPVREEDRTPAERLDLVMDRRVRRRNPCKCIQMWYVLLGCCW